MTSSTMQCSHEKKQISLVHKLLPAFIEFVVVVMKVTLQLMHNFDFFLHILHVFSSQQLSLSDRDRLQVERAYMTALPAKTPQTKFYSHLCQASLSTITSSSFATWQSAFVFLILCHRFHRLASHSRRPRINTSSQNLVTSEMRQIRLHWKHGGRWGQLSPQLFGEWVKRFGVERDFCHFRTFAAWMITVTVTVRNYQYQANRSNLLHPSYMWYVFTRTNCYC